MSFTFIACNENASIEGWLMQHFLNNLNETAEIKPSLDLKLCIHSNQGSTDFLINNRIIKMQEPCSHFIKANLILQFWSYNNALLALINKIICNFLFITAFNYWCQIKSNKNWGITDKSRFHCLHLSKQKSHDVTKCAQFDPSSWF